MPVPESSDTAGSTRGTGTTFLEELRRRKVARAATIYVVVAWALIEGASVILPALGAPEWSLTAVVIAGLAGFPVTLIGAWAFDLTRRGLVRTSPEHTGNFRSGPSRGRILDFAIIAVLAVLVAWLGWERIQNDGSRGGDSLHSIAVLPFANFSGDPTNEYFGDGLAEEVLNALVAVDGLRVAARTSSFQFKGVNQDVRNIGRILGVDSVLEGSVRRAGDRIRVTAQLVRTSDGFHLWSETFDRQLADIFQVQDSITLAIVDALRLQLTPGEARRATTRQTRDVQAFEAYLRGRHHMHQRTQAGFDHALADFREAIERDPDYAAAYSGLADTYLLQDSYGYRPDNDGLRMAEPLARQALDLDPDLAEAQASWGMVLRTRGDLEGSREPFRRAIELNPSYSLAYHWLALSLQELGRFDEAVALLQEMLDFDPRYATGKRALLSLLRLTGADDEADALAERMEADHGDDVRVLHDLSYDWMMRDPVHGTRLILGGIRQQPDALDLYFALATVLAAAGDLERAWDQVEIAATIDAGSLMVRTAPVHLAILQQDPQAAAAALEAVFDATSEAGLVYSKTECDLARQAGLAEVALAACMRALRAHGWRQGAPLPPESGRLGLYVLYAARLSGGHALADRMEPLVQALSDHLRAGGMVERRVAFEEALLESQRGNNEPLLEALPAWLDEQLVSPELVRQDLSFRFVRDDPRLAPLMERLDERMADLRRALDAMEMPAPEA